MPSMQGVRKDVEFETGALLIEGGGEAGSEGLG